MSDGLKVPNAASDRAHVVADVIELHLTWEVENLKHSISPAAAVNSFVGFAALFVPQIRGLAVSEFVGGEDNDNVHAEISAVNMKLMCWIIDQSVTLVETVTPEYASYQPVGWYEEGVKGLWHLDTCLEASCQQHMQCSPEAKIPTDWDAVPGLYSARMLEWAFTQLTWVNRMAGRLERKVGMVPNNYGVKVGLFGLTRQSLKNYLRHGQHQHEVAKHLADAKAAKEKAPGTANGGL
jgi:hypothetical protein